MAASTNGTLDSGSASAPDMTADGMVRGPEPRNNSAEGKPGEYLRELMDEKHKLDGGQWPNAARLLDQEVAKAQSQGKTVKETKYVDIYREKPIKVSVKVLVPSKEHPKFNFVGKLLGPKGNSLKRLQEETMTKMAVLGRGSMKDRTKEEECRNSLDPKYSHLSDDLHVEISAMAPPAEAHARIAFALAEIRKYMVPDSNDEIRQEQFREMEMYSPEGNGVRGGARGGPRGRGGMMRGVPPARGGFMRGGMADMMTTTTELPTSTVLVRASQKIPLAVGRGTRLLVAQCRATRPDQRHTAGRPSSESVSRTHFVTAGSPGAGVSPAPALQGMDQPQPRPSLRPQRALRPCPGPRTRLQREGISAPPSAVPLRATVLTRRLPDRLPRTKITKVTMGGRLGAL